MKNLKKAAALFAAAAMAAGTMSVSALAEDTYKIYVSSEKASVGDTVTVNVIADTSEGIGGISFSLEYNTHELELQKESLQIGDALANWITGDEGGFNLNENGKIGFAYVTMGKGFSESDTKIMSASFKVLKPNSVISLNNAVVNSDDMDATDITDNGQVVGATIECSHKNTETKTTPSTCTVKGKEETVCKDCGVTVAAKELPLIAHTWDNGTVTKPAGCTEKGEMTYKCTVCNETKTEEIPALGHDYVEVKDESKEPTCTESGKKVSKCSRCGDVITEEIPAKGHTYGNWETVKEPTENEEGSEKRVCSACGSEETRAIPVKETTTTTEAPITTTSEAPVTTTAEAPITATTEASETAAAETSTSTAAEASATTAAEDNTQNGDKDNNINTGIALSLIPAAIAAAGVVIAKKRR